MPKLSKARRAALQREEARRLNREALASTKSASPQPTESPIVETQPVLPRGSSRSSKWREKNKKKKSRAVRMQPSVLKFFSVSNVDDRDTEDYYERLTRIRWPGGQPIDVHKATGVEGLNTEQGSGECGSSSNPEGSAGSPQPDAFANPLAVQRDPQVSEAAPTQHQYRV